MCIQTTLITTRTNMNARPATNNSVSPIMNRLWIWYAHLVHSPISDQWSWTPILDPFLLSTLHGGLNGTKIGAQYRRVNISLVKSLHKQLYHRFYWSDIDPVVLSSNLGAIQTPMHSWLQKWVQNWGPSSLTRYWAVYKMCIFSWVFGMLSICEI